MAIHDIDRSPGRSDPTPNTHDNLDGIQPAHGTQSVIFTTQPLVKVLSEIIPGGGGTETITNNPGKFTGKLMPPTQPVAYGQANVSSTGSGTINWVTIPHNLGYVPRVEAYAFGTTIQTGDGTTITTNGAVPLPTFGSININQLVAGAIVFTTYYTAVPDDTNLYLFVYNGTGGATSLNVTYYLFQQTIVGA